MITVFSLVFCMSAVAFGQETIGSIEGYVKDAAGAVVPNVAVTVKSSTGTGTGTDTTGVGTGYNRTLTADGSGFFRLLGVPPGSYVVTTAATSGFGAATYENVIVVVGKATQLAIQVTPGQATAVVDVGGSDAPAIDSTGSEIATNISAQKLALLPKGNNFTDALKAAPGTRPDTFAGGFSVDGATNAENVFVIDGQDVTNYRNAGINANNQVPFALVQELQVKASGFDAEYGGATGGVFSVVTKGGNNDFHGQFGAAFRPSRFQSDPRPSQLRFTQGVGANFVETIEYFNQPKNNFLEFSPTALLSGPIVKNKVWFFGSWTPQITEQTTETTFLTNSPAATRTVNAIPNTNFGRDTYRSTVTNEYSFARIDAEPFSKLRVTGTFLWNPVITEGVIPFNPVVFGSADAPVNFGTVANPIIFQGSALREKQGGRNNANNLSFQAVYTPFQSLIGTFRYNRGFLNQRGNNYFVPTGNQYICQLGNVGGTTFPGACNQGENTASTTQNFREVSVRETYEGDATFLFSAGGRHQIKTGYQNIKIFNDVARGFAQTVTLAYGARINAMPAGGCPSSPATPDPNAIGGGCLTRFGTTGRGSNLAQTFYVQDKWQPIRRLTLNLGVRLESEDAPSFNEFPSGFDFGWSKKIAPRLGFAYDLTGDGKTKIFGSYGKFFDRIKFIVAQGSFGGDFFRVDFFDILPTSGPFTSFTTESVVGNYADPIGGACPTTGFIGSGLSRCQIDFRVASNDPRNNPSESGGIDPDAKPYQQRELTFGIERELSRNYVLRGRYTNKKLLEAIDDAGALSFDGGAEIYITGNPGEGLHAQFLREFGYEEPFFKPERSYNAMEVVLERRLSNNYYFNLNYTLSRLYGNYSGLSNTDELTGRPGSEYNGLARSDPGVNRSFDLPFIGGTALGESDSGRLATDRPHVFNAYGAYIFDWSGSKANSTEFSAFQTIQSGTPQTTNVTFFAPVVFTKRGDLGRTPTFSQTDFGVTHRYRFGRDDRFTLVGNVNIINLFDQKTVTSLQTLRSNGSVAINAFPCTVPANADVCTGGDLDFVKLINRFNDGALLDRINAYLAGDANNLNRELGTYLQPNRYQGVRQVTFGVNLQF